jgi:hypothetical protein
VKIFLERRNDVETLIYLVKRYLLLKIDSMIYKNEKGYIKTVEP